MPYSAPPPELPPPIVAVAETAEASHLTHLLDAAASGKATIANAASRPEWLPSLPEFASDQAQAVPLKESPRFAGYPSGAELLGNTIAKGYLSVDRSASLKVAPLTQPKFQDAATSGAPALPIPKLKAVDLASDRLFNSQASDYPTATNQAVAQTQRQTSAPAQPKSGTTGRAIAAAASSSSYSLSGVSGQLSALSQTTLVNRLNQAFVFDALLDSFQTFQSLAAADLARLSRKQSLRLTQAPINPLVPGIVPTPEGPFTPGLPRVPPSTLPETSPELPNPTPAPEAPIPANGTNPAATPPTLNPANLVEVNADRQEYDERQQVFTAEGNVTMRFRGGLLDADRIQVNLVNRIAVAEGNVALTRGQQVLRGQRFEYNLGQGSGTVLAASGDIFLPTSDTDFAIPAATDNTNTGILARPLSDRVTSQQPQQNVSSPGGISISGGAGRDISRLPGALPRGGQVRRLRFVAEQIDFTPEGWVAKNIQVTNDPFSPPELVLKAERATLTRLSPLEDEVRLFRPRLVFDQRVSIPFFPNRTVLSRRERRPGLFRFAYDAEDRGGFYVEGVFNVIDTSAVQFSVFPQIFLQRMIAGPANTFLGSSNNTETESKGIGDPNNYGFRTTLDARLGASTFLRSSAAFTTVDPGQFSDKLRASVRLQQLLPTSLGVHTLALEYSYRDRLFNGSLGFQTVQSSIGALFLSPNITLGQTGIVLNYQVGYQYVNADTDQENLLSPVRENNRVSLGRFQTTVGLSRSFPLWQGKPLPATPTQGLRYTPNPLTPYISVNTGLRGVFSSYTSGNIQQNLIGSVGIYGQFGHFSRDFFDYTAVGVTYNQVVGSGQSPFLFDRTVDNQVLYLSAFQQIYGPIRVGIQTSINLDTREAISTDYFLEYSRRTHGIIVRYNPVLEIGSISLRISDFNWSGTAEPFEGAGVTPVEGGVIRQRRL
jgi:hypothetical protein